LFARSAATAIAVCFVMLLLSIPGCASTPKPPAPPTEGVRASFGKVGVVSVGPALNGALSAPVGVGSKIGKGAVKGGAIGGLSGAGVGALLGLSTGPCAPVAVPFFATVGAVGGLTLGGGTGAVINGVSAIPESTANLIQAGFTTVVAGRNLQEDFRKDVLAWAGAVHPVIDLGTGSAGDPAPIPDYREGSTLGVDTVLEVGISQIVLNGEGGRDPALVLAIKGQARLVHLPDRYSTSIRISG